MALGVIQATVAGSHSGQERAAESGGEMGVRGGGLGHKDPESQNTLQSMPPKTYFLLLSTPVPLWAQIMSEPQHWAGSHLQWVLHYVRSPLEYPLEL